MTENSMVSTENQKKKNPESDTNGIGKTYYRRSVWIYLLSGTDDRITAIFIWVHSICIAHIGIVSTAAQIFLSPLMS